MSNKQNIMLSSLFDLERIEHGLFRGQSWDLGFRALFGGQVLAQALTAASHTVFEQHACHSLHSYFLRPGDASLPVVYDVETVRDGRSFCTRRIKAIQNGNTLFFMTASFQIKEEGLQHQYSKFPENVPAPEELEPDIAKYERKFDQLSAKHQQVLAYHKPVDIRTVPSSLEMSKTPVRAIWMKASEILGGQQWLNQAALAYASDYHFLGTALRPHGIAADNKNLAIATIDHALWFHGPVDFSDWLLYTMESPFSGGSRGYVKGSLYTRDGKLVASATQEGLMRLRDE